MVENKIPEILPDLPEDWGYGQTVAPEGASVGLSEQHGYNYLMRKVNECARTLNQIVVEMGQIAPDDMVTAKGGGQLLLPGGLGDGPYVIELTEEETDVIASALQEKRAVQTNLASTSPAYFDGTQDIKPGVTGILPVQHGGTGCTSYEQLVSKLGLSSTGGDLSKRITTKRWNGTLTDGKATYISLERPFYDSGFTYAPFILFYVVVTAKAAGTLTVYAGDTETRSMGGSSGTSFGKYYLLFHDGDRGYRRLGVPYSEDEKVNGAIGLKMDGASATYNAYALFMNAGEQ